MSTGVIQLFLGTVALALLAGLLWAARRSGRDSERREAQDRENEARERIDEAARSAPADRSELLDRLRRGGKL